MSKLPAVQFYPGDWRKDVGVQSLSFHDRGVWFEILMLMHESEERGVLILNGRPMSEDAMARLLGLDKQILTTTITNLLDAGVASRQPGTDALMNRRMVRDEQVRKVRTEAGKKGGNPVLLIQNITTRDKQNSTPSSSVSSSTSQQVTPEMVARGVLTELALSGRDLAVVLDEVCRAQMRAGDSPEALRDALIAAWRDYDAAKPRLSYTKGAAKFFGEGDWRNKAGWPWKEAQFQPGIPKENNSLREIEERNKRVAAEKEALQYWKRMKDEGQKIYENAPAWVKKELEAA